MATKKNKTVTSANNKPASRKAGSALRSPPLLAAPPARRTPITGRLFDARPDRLDFRDLAYIPPLCSLPPSYPKAVHVTSYFKGYVKQGLVLDQGSDGACTGFGLAGVINYLLWVQYLEQGASTAFQCVSPRMLYELAKRYDEWQGEDYDGSSCRGALKGWHKHGVCSENLWPFSTSGFVRPLPGWDTDAPSRPLGVYYRIDRSSVVSLQAALLNIGAIYVSARVHDGWDTLMRKRAAPVPKDLQSLPVIPVPKAPGVLGGHAFALVGYDERGFIVQNSWGTRWGSSGFAVLPYEDWVVHGTDAWACALGVPQKLMNTQLTVLEAQVASSFRVGPGRSLVSLDRSTRAPGNPADDPWPFDHQFEQPAYQPIRTSQAQTYTLVTGNDGEIVATDFTRSPSDRVGLVNEIVHDRPLAWLGTHSKQKTLRLALYAHGGLNSQNESMQRIRVLAPCFLANGVYPLFMTWKTGPGETIADMAQDWLRRLFAGQDKLATGWFDDLAEQRDLAFENLANLLGTGIWSKMRSNAKNGAQPGHGLDLLAQALTKLSATLQAQGCTLELHFVGHSAGAILLGHLLDLLGKNPANRVMVKSCQLFAPACSMEFAVEHYLGAHVNGVLEREQIWLDVLSDENEKADGLPTPSLPAYGKSLLYLVSRALESVRKQPLLGMATALDPKYANDIDKWDASTLAAIRVWQANWPSKPDRKRVCTDRKVRVSKDNQQMQATHGSFDNNIDVISFVLTRITNKQLISALEWLDY